MLKMDLCINEKYMGSIVHRVMQHMKEPWNAMLQRKLIFLLLKMIIMVSG